jgi:hypothetical protein
MISVQILHLHNFTVTPSVIDKSEASSISHGLKTSLMNQHWKQYVRNAIYYLSV